MIDSTPGLSRALTYQDLFVGLLETAIQDDKIMEDFELESLLMGDDHCHQVKAPPIILCIS
jgi:hypothetical protein